MTFLNIYLLFFCSFHLNIVLISVDWKDSDDVLNERKPGEVAESSSATSSDSLSPAPQGALFV